MLASRGDSTRRTFLLGAWATASLGAMGCRTTRDTAKTENAAGDGRLAMRPADAPTPDSSDALDDALDRLSSRGPAYAGGLANHAPMVAEALVALGRTDAMGPWIDGYGPRLEPWPRSAGRIAPQAWPDALGKSEHASDWRALFEEELQNAPFRDVLVRWLPRLGAGMSGSAAHGVIRVSHVVRALAVRETPARRRELAAGLAYWASTFHRLPDAPHPSAKLTVGAAIDQLEMVPTDRRGQGSIVDRLAPLREMPSFARAADLVDFGADPAVVLSDVTGAFARVYCANADQRDGRIARIHAITGPSALRPLLPHLPAAVLRSLLRSVWQLDAAVYATHVARGVTAPVIEPFASSADLIAAAIESRDEHAIKLTEVALREDAVAADPAFALSAAHWVRASLG